MTQMAVVNLRAAANGHVAQGRCVTSMLKNGSLRPESVRKIFDDRLTGFGWLLTTGIDVRLPGDVMNLTCSNRVVSTAAFCDSKPELPSRQIILLANARA